MDIPFRSFCCGQSVVPIGNLQRRIDGYYPMSNRKLVIEQTDDYQYKIRPVGYDDILEASHWDLLPALLTRTRYYAPSNLVLSGVVVRPIGGKLKMVKEVQEKTVQYTDGSVGGIEPVEIYRSINDPENILCYLREECL